jgi:hypothetical protein
MSNQFHPGRIDRLSDIKTTIQEELRRLALPKI